MKKCLLALALLFAVLLSGCAIVQTTDLADYGNTGGETWHGSAVFDLLSNLTSTGDADGTQSAAPPRMQELFPIFPPDALLQRAQDRDYHHLYRYTLLPGRAVHAPVLPLFRRGLSGGGRPPRGARRNL